MAHPGGSGGNMGRPSNPSGHFTPSSFPTPATICGQPSQALFQENQCEASFGARARQLAGHAIAADTLVVPPAMAPRTFHFQPGSQPHWTMPQAGGAPNAMPLQHFSGTAAVQPLHGNELAASVAAINTLPYQHQQPFHELDGYGATSWTRPMLPPSGLSGSWAPPVQQVGGAGGQASWAWAPPAQHRPGMPAASPASGSAQAQPPRVTTGKKTLEESLLEAGVLDEQTFEKIFLDDLAEEMQLGDDGHAERDDRWVCLGDVLLSLGAVSSSSSGAGMPTQEALGAVAMGRGRDEAPAAAEARERRSRRTAMRKEAAARHHRHDKHAAPRGSQDGPGAI